MKNPFSNETVKSAAIVIGSAAAFIALSKGVSILRKKFGGNAKVKAIFGAAENANRGSKCLSEGEKCLSEGEKCFSEGKKCFSECEIPCTPGIKANTVNKVNFI